MGGWRARSLPSIGAKFRAVVIVLATILLGICGLVVFEASLIRKDMRRASEERREADQARALQLDLEGFERVVGLRAEQRSDAASELGALDQLGHLDGALRSLAALAPPHDDPSESEHEADEARHRGLLVTLLHDTRAGISAGTGTPAQWRERAAEMLRHARDLHDEVLQAAHSANVDLDLRSGQLIRFVSVLAVVALFVLIGVCVYVSRGLVRPLRALADGTRRIGHGELAHPLPSTGGAEIVELSREIRAMADALAANRRDLEARVEQRTRELVRSARLADVGAVAAGLAHEINTPLASIVACADWLQRRLGQGRADPTQQREYLQIIGQEAERVREMTARLLEIARPATSELRAVDAAEAVRSATMLSRHRFAQRGVTLRAEPASVLPAVRSNAAELAQVLLNLLNNALDASPAGGVVTVGLQRSGSELLLDVDDQGPGVSPEVSDKIFDPFFTTKDPGHGTGLGLAIVQGILERQGGHIELIALRPGARFRVRLPIATD